MTSRFGRHKWIVKDHGSFVNECLSDAPAVLAVRNEVQTSYCIQLYPLIQTSSIYLRAGTELTIVVFILNNKTGPPLLPKNFSMDSESVMSGSYIAYEHHGWGDIQKSKGC